MGEKLHTRLDREAAKLWVAWRVLKRMLPSLTERGASQRTALRGRLRNQLAGHYLPFAEQLGEMAAQRNPNVDRDDAIQEATIGLIEAIEKFDPSNGALPSTFLGWRIRGGAVEAARKQDYVTHKVRMKQKLLRARAVESGEMVPCDLVPEMTSVRFESSPTLLSSGVGVTEPESRPEVSPVEHNETLLKRILDAADPTVARYARDFLEAQRDPQRDGHTDVADLLAKRWQMTPEGAGALVRACISSLQTVRIAA